jgi:hypothetical protein
MPNPEDFPQLQQQVPLVAPQLVVPNVPPLAETPFLPPPAQPEPPPPAIPAPVGLVPTISAPRPPQEANIVAEGLGLPTQVSPLALPTHHFGYGPLTKLLGKLSPQLQSGIVGALGTVASMQPPPPVSGPGFAISNIAGGLRGMQERALQSGIALDTFARERAKDIYGIQKEATEAEYEPEKIHTQLEVARQGLTLKARELEIEAGKIPNFRLYFSPFTGQPLVIDERTGAVSEVPDAQETQTQMLGAMGEFESTLRAAIPALARQSPSPSIQVALNALAGQVEYASQLPAIKRMKQLDNVVSALNKFAKDNPEIGLAMQRLDLANKYYNLKKMSTLFQAGQVSNLLNTHNAVVTGLHVIDAIDDIVQKEFLGKKIPEKQITFTPEERTAIMEAVQKSNPPQDMRDVTTWSQAVAGSVRGLLNHILQKKGVPITTKGYAELLARIPQLAAQLAFVHTQGRGSVTLAAEYAGLIEKAIGSPSVIPSLLRQYRSYMNQKLQEGLQTAVIGVGAFENIENIGEYIPSAFEQTGVPVKPFTVRPQAPSLVPQSTTKTPAAGAASPKALAPAPKKKGSKLDSFFKKLGVEE